MKAGHAFAINTKCVFQIVVQVRFLLFSYGDLAVRLNNHDSTY